MEKSVQVVENSACLHGCGASQAGTQAQDPAAIRAATFTCNRISEGSLLYAIGAGGLPCEGATFMKGMVAFVMDCIQGLRYDDEITFSKEGLSGLWSLLLIVKEGIGEIEGAFKPAPLQQEGKK